MVLVWSYFKIHVECKVYLIDLNFGYVQCYPSVPFVIFAFLGLRINRLCYGSALCISSARASARSKTCDVLCIPARYLVTLAILSGDVCSPLLHFLAQAQLEADCNFLLNGV